MVDSTSVLVDREVPDRIMAAGRSPHRPPARHGPLLAILTDPAVLRIALLACGVSALLLAVAAVL